MNEVDLVDRRLVAPDLSNLVGVRGSVVRVEIDDGRMTGFAVPEGLVRDAVFRGCRIDLSSFAFARLERVVFADCRLEEADFREAALKRVRFERCDLSRADFTKARCRDSEMRRCTLEGLRGATGLAGVAMEWEDIVGGAGLWAAAIGIGLVEES